MTSYIHPVIHEGDKIIIFDRLHISVSYLQFCKMVVTSTYLYLDDLPCILNISVVG
jgi:hypothetical protein